MFSFPIIFSIIQERSIQILFFALFTDKKFNIFHQLPKLCKINPNFNLILSNEITAGANRKLFTLTQNGLKVIAANQDNHAEWSLLTAIPTSIGNDYYCPGILLIRSQSSHEYFFGGPFFC